MSAPDMEVIKEIPGYKVILKAVLKSQIQQLVETLAAHTDEESVILTASVSDGTLSHLGSDSGKSFLEDHEDVKSQFLGFCLKRHHRKKQVEKEQEALKAASVIPPHLSMIPGFQPRPSFQSRTPRMGIPRHLTPRHSMPSQGGFRPIGRHEPYPVSRPMKRNSFDSSEQPSATVSSASVKQEPADNDNSVNNGVVPGSSQNNDSDSLSGANVGNNDDTTQDSNISSDATLPNTPNTQGNEHSEADPNAIVKLEALTENEMELEITGVTPGRNTDASPENWGQDNSVGMPYDPSAGNLSDVAGGGQDYNIDSVALYLQERQKQIYQESGSVSALSFPSTQTMSDLKEFRPKRYVCTVCGKSFKDQWKLSTHFRVHSGEKPFECEVCHKKFAAKGNLKTHMVIHLQDKLNAL